MREEDKTIAIDYSDNSKNAALFFDYVVPIGGVKLLKKVLLSVKWEMISILPPQFQSLRFIHNARGLATVSDDSAFSRIDNHLFNAIRILGEFYDFGKIFPIYDSNENVLCTESHDFTSLELAQLPLINTANTKWEQILEFREDVEAMKKLRNLRLFFHENYSGKEKNYVEDDLSKRLEDYKNTAKDWGFETITSSIQMLLTSPVTLTSVGTSLAMALFGEPLSAIATAGTGVGLEIGKISLHIAKEKKKLSVLQRDHPLAYIIDAKKKLE